MFDVFDRRTLYGAESQRWRSSSSKQKHAARFFPGGEFAIQQTPRFGIHNLRRIGGLVTAVFLASATISDSFSSQVL
jgi:hypothetical protein